MCQEKRKVLVVTDTLEREQRSLTLVKVKCLGKKESPKVDLKDRKNSVYAKAQHNARTIDRCTKSDI